jgi:hypothetical protein
MTDRCPGCGLVLHDSNGRADDLFYASAACRDLFNTLSYYTLAQQDSLFIHQVAVDAYTAQHAGLKSKPMTVYFALAGLYLVNERDFTGRQVQRVHMALAQRPREWPEFEALRERDWLTVQHPVAAPDESRRDAILAWSRSVWEAWKADEGQVAAALRAYLDV